MLYIRAVYFRMATATKAVDITLQQHLSRNKIIPSNKSHTERAKTHINGLSLNQHSPLLYSVAVYTF